MQLSEINPFVRLASVASNNFRENFCAAYDARIIYVVQGKGELCINDNGSVREFRLKENSLVYIPAGVFYRIVRDEKDGLEVFVVNFDFPYDNSENKQAIYPQEAENYDVSDAHMTPEDIFPEIYRKPFVMDTMQTVRANIREIVGEFEKKYNYYEEIVSSMMKTVLCRIAANPFSDSKTDATFQRFVEYVEKNYGKNIENSEVAAALCYHPNYLNSVVKNKTGKSMHKYIMEYRIMQAARLLISTELSVGDVALLTGFKNADHFSVYFKKIMGITASEYSKAYV